MTSGQRLDFRIAHGHERTDSKSKATASLRWHYPGSGSEGIISARHYEHP